MPNAGHAHCPNQQEGIRPQSVTGISSLKCEAAKRTGKQPPQWAAGLAPQGRLTDSRQVTISLSHPFPHLQNGDRITKGTQLKPFLSKAGKHPPHTHLECEFALCKSGTDRACGQK